ncbi:unnamed protein product [Rotaria magnacalcarata]|uniref:Uncharacterized protein n=1 Tax=Rotaria magnacalcarata TaxID=392030 RepID=A0A816VEN3_9BILA|nr:unnamed protein product [Rotaria magnacalcarata]CAF1591964.1 unnamed protein product [Rotaria magnacalcarata]CAF2119134.1 unnamed protein product [Rotaria magnacalcarata]CAF3859931.1 unnamed protein product [Rotaria magnacalcarata]CAF3988233.1 unnamed protein product [Rotaria magnacalcarata]
MNELETKLTLWAIVSIILFEVLIIICLCRWYVTRARPKKFYVKREEYEYIPDINSNPQTKFQSTILRPPHADELALVGTIRAPHPIVTYNRGIQNHAFYSNDEDRRIPPVFSSSLSSSSSSASSQHWFDLQSPIIKTAQLPPADYEIHSYPTDNYAYRHSVLPRPMLIDFRQYREDSDDDENDQLENYRFQSFRRPEVIVPQVQRIDTSTEFYGMSCKNVVPKSILKSSTSITPPIDFLSTPYLQTQRTRTLSNHEQSPQVSIKFTTHRSIPINYSANINEKRPSIESNLPLASKSQIKFANVSALHDIKWEVPREFQTILHDTETFDSSSERTVTTTTDSRRFTTQKNEMNISRAHYLSKDDIAQQKALEY